MLSNILAIVIIYYNYFTCHYYDSVIIPLLLQGTIFPFFFKLNFYKVSFSVLWIWPTYATTFIYNPLVLMVYYATLLLMPVKQINFI